MFPPGRRPQGRLRTRWRDYVSQLAWERLREVPPEELEEVVWGEGSLCISVILLLVVQTGQLRQVSPLSAPIQAVNVTQPGGEGLQALTYNRCTYPFEQLFTHSSNTIIKSADDMIVISLITGDDETAYRKEVRALTSWCQDNNLHLNVSKTKELIVDFRKRQREEHAPLSINRTTVERVKQLQVRPGLIHTDFITKTSRQWLFFLRRLWRFNMNLRILCSFYRCIIERILTGCMTTWYAWQLHHKALQRVVKAAQHITRTELPSLEDLYTECKKKTNRIIKASLSLVVRARMLHLEPSARRQQAEQFVAGVTGVLNDFGGLLPTPLGVEVLHGWQLRPGDVLSSFHHPL
ncbi:hypothetical protein L3Q82_011536 [Scortum barcoo]|uniref:Uncharacterized protein n=1 Tax=Scortum barcoo TaxID=214431 RepID=A0ACB8W8I3_9TELE|nr:hypothetical protein L3Q82_011536 [Scortum barcoo]